MLLLAVGLVGSSFTSIVSSFGLVGSVGPDAACGVDWEELAWPAPRLPRCAALSAWRRRFAAPAIGNLSPGLQYFLGLAIDLLNWRTADFS